MAESDECSSDEDLLDLCPSLRDSEYFRDLQLGSTEPPNTQPTALNAPDKSPTSLIPLLSTPESESDQYFTESDTHQLEHTVISSMDRLIAVKTSESQDYPASDQDEDSDMDTFPILVRSMSTSRRHSWECPVSPIDLGRRYDSLFQ